MLYFLPIHKCDKKRKKTSSVDKENLEDIFSLVFDSQF
jgi:hypothetical protein